MLWNDFTKEFTNILSLGLLPNHMDAIRLVEIAQTNVLLRTQRGFPVDLIWEEGIRRRFKLDHRLKRNQHVFAKTIPYAETEYYIELDILHPDMTKDCEELPNFLKTIISHRCIHTDKHIIVIKNLDMIINPQPIRVILERFSMNVMFVCTTYNASAIERPIQSRFQHIRVPQATQDEILAILGHLGVNNKNPKVVSLASTRNLIKSLFAYNSSNNNKNDKNDSNNKNDKNEGVNEGNALNMAYNYPPLEQQLVASASIEKLRELSYKICQYNISLSEAALDLLAELKRRKRPVVNIHQFIAKAAEIENMYARSQRGRMPIYMEALLHEAVYGSNK